MESMDPRTHETIRFLKGLTNDGQLAATEIWELASFLNDRPEHRDIWPGSVLFPLLLKCFDDQELTPQELAQIARAITEIEQHWESHQRLLSNWERARAWNRAAQVETAQPAATEERSLILQPALPSYPEQLSIQSSDGDEFYEVDLARQTCTCPDWQNRRHALPASGIGRMCKHIAEAYASLQPQPEGWVQALVSECLRRNRGVHPENRWGLFQVGGQAQTVLASIGQNEDWINVYANGERFGYNPIEDRWAYGDQPPFGDEIKGRLHTAF